MAADFKIACLFEHQSLIPIIEKHFKKEWHAYYGPEGPGEARADIDSFCNTTILPVGLIALRNDRITGIVSLREKTESQHDLGPWVTSFYVVPERRGQGVGTRLVHAVECLAQKLGYKKIYARSATAVVFFEKLKWVPFDTLTHDAEQMTIFLKDLPANPSE